MNNTPTVGPVLSFLLQDEDILSHSALKSIVDIADLSGSYFVDIAELNSDDFNVFSQSVLSFYSRLVNVSFPALYAYSNLLELLASDTRISAESKSRAAKLLDDYRKEHHDNIVSYEANRIHDKESIFYQFKPGAKDRIQTKRNDEIVREIAALVPAAERHGTTLAISDELMGQRFVLTAVYAISGVDFYDVCSFQVRVFLDPKNEQVSSSVRTLVMEPLQKLCEAARELDMVLISAWRNLENERLKCKYIGFSEEPLRHLGEFDNFAPLSGSHLLIDTNEDFFRAMKYEYILDSHEDKGFGIL